MPPSEPIVESPAHVPGDAAAAPDPRQRDYAIVVGISRYPDISDLKGPENDAKNVYEWLTSPIGGGVPTNRATLILSSQFPNPGDESKPTTEAIIDAFEKVLKPALKNGESAGRRLYVYMAGHGFGPQLDDTALFTANADTLLGLGHHIAGKRFADWIAAASLFDEVALFMDCCRDLFRFATPSNPPWPNGIVQPPGARTFYAFGTQWGFKSFERPTGGSQTVQGAFTRSMLAGLKGGGRDPVSGQITDSSLKAFIINDMTQQSAAANVTGTGLMAEQRPSITNSAPMVFVFGATPTGTKVTISFPQPQNLPVDVFNPHLQVIQTGGADRPIVLNAVEPGIYKVRVRGTARQVYFEITSQEAIDVLFTA